MDSWSQPSSKSKITTWLMEDSRAWVEMANLPSASEERISRVSCLYTSSKSTGLFVERRSSLYSDWCAHSTSWATLPSSSWQCHTWCLWKPKRNIGRTHLRSIKGSFSLSSKLARWWCKFRLIETIYAVKSLTLPIRKTAVSARDREKSLNQSLYSWLRLTACSTCQTSSSLSLALRSKRSSRIQTNFWI